jgi:phosphoribosylanthranilate isomerase
MWIKICGNTTLKDAARAAELGADAVGFIFAPSRRQVTAAQVASITAHLPATVETVGVFTTSAPDEIASVVKEAQLHTVQLHSTLDGDRLQQLAALLPGVNILPVVSWNADDTEAAIAEVTTELDELAEQVALRRVLIDARVGGSSGGTGVSIDWLAARPVFQKQIERGLQPILAGGLRPENVTEAIRSVHPFGVDVSSGVEKAPGVKDHARLAEFLKNARG